MIVAHCKTNTKIVLCFTVGLPLITAVHLCTATQKNPVRWLWLYTHVIVARPQL